MNDHDRFRREFRQFFWVVSFVMLATLILILVKETNRHDSNPTDTDGAFPSFVCLDSGEHSSPRPCEDEEAAK